MKIRKATIDDTLNTYKWVNDKKIRRYSFSREAVSLKEHKKWFEDKLKSENCIYFIAELNGEAIGSIRYDIKDKIGKLNYLIDTSYQGKGFGKKILVLSIQYLQEKTTIKEIYGEVLADNISSVKTFERLNFIKKQHQNGLISYSKLI